MSKKDSDRVLSFGERAGSKTNEVNKGRVDDMADVIDASIGIDKETLTDGLETKEEKELMEEAFPEESEMGQTPTPNNLDTGRFGLKRKEANNVVRIPKSHRKEVTITFFVIVLLVIGFAVYWHFKSFESYEVVASGNRKDETAMEYIQFQGGFVKYNVDGITYEDKTGTIVWTEAFTMISPKVVICGEYVAVTDIGNNEYILYNASKKVCTVTTDFPISDIQVAAQGLVAVVLEEEKADYITAFDSSGAKVLEIKTTISKNGYPMAIAMSDDGSKLVASYVVIDGEKVTSALTFYNFGNVGKNEVDRQVGSMRFEDELFPRIAFANNDTVVAFSDAHILLYSMKEKPKQILNRKITEKVRSVFYNSAYVGYIANADVKPTSGDSVKHSVKNSDDEDSNLVLRTFSLSGKRGLDKDIPFYYTKLHADEKQIILVGRKACRVYTAKGNLKFKCKFKDGVSDLFSSPNYNQYVLMTPDKTETIKLK